MLSDTKPTPSAIEVPVSRSRLQCVVLLLSFLMAAGAAPDAAAQFGKLKKALGDKAADKAPCVPDRAPTVVETVSLTPAQMAAVNAGLEAEIQAAPAVYAEADQQQKESEKQQKEYQKAREAYDKANEKYQACADKVVNQDQAKSEELNQKSDAAGQELKGQVNEEDIQKLAERAQAAAERVSAGTGTAEDRATLAEFQRKMAGVRAGSDAAIAAQQTSSNFNSQQNERVEKACGKKPVEPTPPAGADLPGQKVRSAGAKAANMSDQEYTVAREDLLALAMGNAVVKGSGKGGKEGDNASSSKKPSDDDADAMNKEIKDAAKKVCDMKKAKIPLF